MILKVLTNWTAPFQVKKLEGVDHYVVPMVMLTEGVHNGNEGPLYYDEAGLKEYAEVWNHKPIVVYHPEIDGKGVSACQPVILNRQKVGVILNVRYEDKKLKADAWLHPSQLQRVDPRIANSLKAGKQVEVSTGLSATVEKVSGMWNNEAYTGLVRDYRPDHLAILPDQVGACSIADGAGLLQNSAENAILPLAWQRMAVEELIAPIRANLLVHNELSFSDIGNDLCDALSKKMGEPGVSWYGYIIDVYSDHVIFRNSDGELYSVNYKITGEEVSLTSEPTKVERQVVYVPDVENKENPMKSKVDTLIANGKFKETDREWLMGQTEERLTQLTNISAPTPTPVVPPTVPVVTPVPVTNLTATPQSIGDWLTQTNPPPEIRAVLTNGVAMLQQQRDEITARILAVANCTLTKAELEVMAFPQLNAIANMVAPVQVQVANTYFGQSAAPIINAAPPKPETPLTIEPIDYSKVQRSPTRS